MPDFHHQPAPAEEIDQARTARNARLGLILFVLYSSCYAAFMLLNAFVPQVMEMPFLAGINLAICFGLGLILLAFLLALLYAWLCRRPIDRESRP